MQIRQQLVRATQIFYDVTHGSRNGLVWEQTGLAQPILPYETLIFVFAARRLVLLDWPGTRSLHPRAFRPVLDCLAGLHGALHTLLEGPRSAFPAPAGILLAMPVGVVALVELDGAPCRSLAIAGMGNSEVDGELLAGRGLSGQHGAIVDSVYDASGLKPPGILLHSPALEAAYGLWMCATSLVDAFFHAKIPPRSAWLLVRNSNLDQTLCYPYPSPPS